jgi:S-layer protein
MAITDGALSNTTAQGLLDAKTVQNKLAVATNFTIAIDTTAEINGYSGNSAAASARALLAQVTDATDVTAFQPTVVTALANIVTDQIPTVTTTLTTGVDTITGSAGKDIINGQYAPAVNGGNTLSGLDSIDGGNGNDILNINDVTGGTSALVGISLKNVETVNLASAGAAVIDSTAASVSGVKAVNVTQGTTANVTAGSTTAVTVGGITLGATVVGGSTQTVTANGGLTLSKAAGAIVATDTAQGAVASTIDGGTTVTLVNNATNAGGTTGTIKIGNTTAPTGAISVTQNLTNAAAAATNTTGGAITINGGTTVSVTETAAQALMTTASTNSKIVQSDVNVNGGASTTTVTVTQAAAVTAANTVAAVTGVTETASVQFAALAAGKTITLAGLTLTAPAGGLTAKQVATAFSNLANGVATGWTTAAVTGGAAADTVVFSSTGSGNVADLADTGDGTATTITTTAGVAAVSANAGKGGVDLGAVTIVDGGNGTISTVTLNNFGNSTINSKGLTNVTLSGKSGTLGITHAAGTTLDLTLNTLSGTNTISDASNGYTTLKVHTTGGNSTVANIVDSGATSLTVDGDKALTLTSVAGLNNLKTITVSGAAGLTVGGALAATVTDVNASATSGNVTLAIDATAATYEGGSGTDTLTIAAAPTKAISGGAGNDVLVVNIAGGFNASANTNISGFETLALGALATTNYDATGFLHLSEGAVAAAVAFTNVAAGVDLNITGNVGFGTTYTLKDATGTSDALTLNLKAAGAIVANTVTAAGIETVTISSTDTTSGVAAGATTNTLTLVDAAAKSIVVTGNTTLNLTSANTAVTSVDASGMTGGLIYTAAGTVAETIKGGATSNTLFAATNATTADVLIGGAGNDVLTANKGLDTLTGNGGNDKFVIVASANVNSYATITDANAGDVIQFVAGAVETFSAAKISLAATAVFQDYANAAVNAGGAAGTDGYITWFQYGGDTYIVESLHDAAATHDFQNGIDAIVKLTGLVDLSTATLFQDGANPGVNPLVVIH